MPRRGELLALSREHHGALLLARDAMRLSPQADRTLLAAMNRRIADYWKATMAAHFRHEESLLLRHPGALPATLAMRLLEEHRQLAAMSVRAAAGALEAAAVRDYGRCLAAHVRFEERECFDVLQRAADAASARAAGGGSAAP